MAGIFGFFDYTKPGPGVPKDGPPKAPIVVFFEILQRKFWNLIKINIMFNIFNLPAIIVGLFVSFFIYNQIIMPGPEGGTSEAAVYSDIFFRFLFSAIFMCIPVITVGPAQAGFTYLLRNYSREEHAFIWDDFKENALKNFKQSSIISLIDLVVLVLMLFSLKVYLAFGTGSILMSIGTAFMFMILALFFMMHLYIYPMLVTFKLSIKQVYKNAAIFTIIKLFPNIGITLICIFILFLTFGVIIPFNPIIGLILYAFITVSLIGMITNFYVYPKLKKYMMREEEEAEEDGEEAEEEDGQDDDSEGSEEPEDIEDQDSDNENNEEPKRYY